MMYKPEGDHRHREFNSVKLWLVYRKIDNGKVTLFGINDSIERTIYELKDRNGLFVQYKNEFYPLHSKKEFEYYRKLGLQGGIYYFSNYSSVSFDINSEDIPKIESAEFIFYDEAVCSVV